MEFSSRLCVVLLLVLLMTTPCAKEALAASVIGSTSVYLYAIADAYVNSTAPDVNYGSSTSLILHTDSYECYSYIMFNLSSIPSNAVILSAELRVSLAHVSGYGCDIGAYYCSDNSWDESEITWSNKPDFASEPTDTVKFRWPIVMTGYKYWNLTIDQAMLSTGRLTEVLVLDWSEQYTYANFDSSEAKDDRICRSNMPPHRSTMFPWNQSKIQVKHRTLGQLKLLQHTRLVRLSQLLTLECFHRKLPS
jgi:hypothetical protein